MPVLGRQRIILCAGVAVVVMTVVISDRLLNSPYSITQQQPQQQQHEWRQGNHEQEYTRGRETQNTSTQHPPLKSQPQQQSPTLKQPLPPSPSSPFNQQLPPNPVYNRTCYIYHQNVTAENRCCRLVNFSRSRQTLNQCPLKANEHLHAQNRRSVYWVILGDSHMRYTFASLLALFNGPHLQYKKAGKAREGQSKWMSAASLDSTIRQTKIWESFSVRDQSINFTLDYYWDPFLVNLPGYLNHWLDNPREMPNLFVFDGAQHFMYNSEQMYKRDGAEAAVVKYRTALQKMRPKLVSLAAQTRVVFKLLDHLLRSDVSHHPDRPHPLNDDTNFHLNNRVAREVLTGSGVVVWDSTLPLSHLYAKKCLTRNINTPPRYYWKCKDDNHVGFILSDQYANMIVNDYCNAYLDLGVEYCGQ
ncbi:hypothetical protein Pcinc_021845 [Petrolisthes cinctipes]|uniref:Uncharacterized protein n=1 Tax=Petrolisthes cinctipes TaxID=88211 RepID=A0AAE1KEH8_PETCI|nr:hypothetical protein Pcinc_021845 [Petrolisthes cinctipes]